MRLCLTLLSVAFFLISTSHAKVIRFGPLPIYKSEIVLQQYQGLFNHLADKLDLSFEIVYFTEYADLIDAVKTRKVDIAHLGPLPYAKLLQEPSESRPIVKFLNEEGGSTYTCSLFSPQNIPFETAIKGPIVLPQPLSTCGLLSVAYLLKKRNLNLFELEYYHVKTHSRVVLDLLLGNGALGSARTSVFNQYAHLGLTKIDTTFPLPGFLWVASAALPQELLQEIQVTLALLNPRHNASHATMMQKWGEEFKHGAVIASEEDYAGISQMLLALEQAQ
jgi:phosphonate transport system substrate-binding protein